MSNACVDGDMTVVRHPTLYFERVQSFGTTLNKLERGELDGGSTALATKFLRTHVEIAY
jgi:hypothetical protein